VKLVLFFNPLFALLMLFLEWEILDFGTAIKIEGNSSSREEMDGNEIRGRDGRARARCHGTDGWFGTSY